MNAYLVGFAAVLGAIAWLTVLVATSFNLCAVSAGLLAVLFLNGGGQTTHHH